MKPGRFVYHAPRGLDETVSLLGDYADEAKVLAGGQSLMPLLNFRLARVENLIDINRIGARYAEISTGDTIVIPALVRQRQAERSPELAEALPLLREALQQVAHPQIRNRGTLCGSLAHADPAAELPAVMSVLDTTFTIASTRGLRTVEVADFFRFHLTTALAPDELLLQVSIRRPPPGTVTVFREFATRRGDFALAAVAAAVRFDDSGTVTDCRLAAAGVAPTPHRLSTVEELVTGYSPAGAGTSTTSNCPVRCMPPSCAHRTPTPASSAWTPPRPGRRPVWWRCSAARTCRRSRNRWRPRYSIRS